MTVRLQSPEHIEWRGHLEHLKTVLADAQAHRDDRQDMVDTTDANGNPARELGWVVFEWDTMPAAINRLRAKAGLEPVDIYAVRHDCDLSLMSVCSGRPGDSLGQRQAHA